MYFKIRQVVNRMIPCRILVIAPYESMKNILLFIRYFFHAAVSLSIPLEHVFGIIPYYLSLIHI